jgi:mRNA interferase HigB
MRGIINRLPKGFAVRVIAKSALREFWKRHPDSEQPLRAWHGEAKAAAWQAPTDVKAKYRSASILRGGRVVFNVGGSKYRLVVKINYPFQVIYIRFIGTHHEYDHIDAETI